MKFHKLKLSVNHLYFRESLKNCKLILWSFLLVVNVPDYNAIRNEYHPESISLPVSIGAILPSGHLGCIASQLGSLWSKKGFLFHLHSISQSSFFFKSCTETTGHESNFVCLIDGLSKIHILHRSKAWAVFPKHFYGYVTEFVGLAPLAVIGWGRPTQTWYNSAPAPA